MTKAIVAIIADVVTKSEINLNFHFYGHQVAGSQIVHSLKFAFSFDFSTDVISVQTFVAFQMCLPL